MFKRKILENLKEWKENPDRKPLILRGARQVGKTSVVKIFAADQFEDFVNINLEDFEQRRVFEHDMSLHDFIELIEIHYKKKLVPGKTLLFIDEIQNNLNLLKLLRFFYEELPDLHVIAAGSLLEATIRRQGLSLPVGRIEYRYLYPLDFFEYLEAKGEHKLLDTLKAFKVKTPLSEGVHSLALEHFYHYTMIGGMPEIVAASLKDESPTNLERLYSALLTAYSEDTYKYSSEAKIKYLQYAIEQAPLHAGTTLSYEKFGQNIYKSREIKSAYDLLEQVMLLNPIKATQSTDLPLKALAKRPRKLLFLDVGLVNFRAGIQSEYLKLQDLNEFHRGRIAEQVVGQQLLAQSVYQPKELYYWARPKAQSAAEIDFCMSHQGKIVGIEVKSGSSSRLRSLFSFANQVPAHLLVRVSSLPFRIENVKIADKSYRMINIPFYLLPKLTELLNN